MITYWTWSGATPARSSAALMATDPSWAPLKSFNDPDILPIGVRAPATITDPDTADLHRLRWRATRRYPRVVPPAAVTTRTAPGRDQLRLHSADGRTHGPRGRPRWHRGGGS